MSDNTTIPVGVGGDTIRTIDRTLSDPAALTPQKTQVVQLDAGGEGQESLISQTNPLPVSTVGGEQRVLIMLAVQQFLLAQSQPHNGFIPQEIPVFIGGF